MATIEDVLKNFESVQLEEAIPRIVRSLSAELIDYNLDQLAHGITSENVLIQPRYRSRDYAGYKNTLNPKAGFGVPDLKLAGDFYAGFYVQLNGMTFEFGSRDSKSALLEGKYSKNGGIYGLTDNNKSNFAQNEVKPEIIKHLQNKTGLPKK